MDKIKSNNTEIKDISNMLKKIRQIELKQNKLMRYCEKTARFFSTIIFIVFFISSIRSPDLYSIHNGNKFIATLLFFLMSIIPAILTYNWVLKKLKGNLNSKGLLGHTNIQLYWQQIYMILKSIAYKDKSESLTLKMREDYEYEGIEFYRFSFKLNQLNYEKVNKIIINMLK